MRYSCNCPEWEEERPCDNPNEDVECQECLYAKEEAEDYETMQ